MSRPLPVLPDSRFGVFTAAESVLSGWTESAVKNAIRRGRIVRVAYGCYVTADAWAGDEPADAERRLAIRTVAAQLAVRPSVASHRSAAVLAGLPLWNTPSRPCVTVSPRYTGDTRGVHLHRATLDADDRLLAAEGVRTRTARTIVDVARERGVEDAVVIGDAALARQMTDADRLHACLRRCEGWPGSRRARQVLELLDPRSESPLESVSRIGFRGTSVPRPELQTEILTMSGQFVGRLDFYWDEFGVAGEADGLMKYRDDPFTATMKQRHRQGLLDELGIIFVRWGLADLREMPMLAGRFERAFARGARRPRSERLWIPRFAPQTYALGV